MKVALIILGVMVIYFIIRTLFGKGTSSFHTSYNTRNKDGSVDATVPMKYVKGKLKKRNIENIQCPKCGLHSNDLNWFEYRTSDDSWDHLAGRQGFYANCPACNIEVKHIETIMS
jgi:ssDNA-binding Zn-finger/Zn-ribbon topoisomerase 1